MKQFLMGLPLFILSLFIYLFVHDYNYNKYAAEHLKVVCEEASAAGSLFWDLEQYSEGKIVFNYKESEKAIKAIIKEMLDLDDSFNPLPNSYWFGNNITYKIYFFDDNYQNYPGLFVDPDSGYNVYIKNPQIIVTINAGSGRYTLPFLKNNSKIIRSSSHAWVAR